MSIRPSRQRCSKRARSRAGVVGEVAATVAAVLRSRQMSRHGDHRVDDLPVPEIGATRKRGERDGANASPRRELHERDL